MDYQHVSESSSSSRKNAGRRKVNETRRHPTYRGVRQRNGSKWVCEVREPNKSSRIWLGTFLTPEMAARAHDAAALALRGNSAALNFHDSAWVLPRPKSCSPEDIKATAVEAAQAFSPCTYHNSGGSSLENGGESHNSETFWDEEAVFDMPNLLDSMAEGLLLTPPSMYQRSTWDDVDSNMDMSLWTDY